MWHQLVDKPVYVLNHCYDQMVSSAKLEPTLFTTV